ncbi:hypothetical protein KM043_013308 [Ampulex compressa]|nr:hypothetical protein KM043_013308 [Ampulex compressa]
MSLKGHYIIQSELTKGPGSHPRLHPIRGPKVPGCNSVEASLFLQVCPSFDVGNHAPNSPGAGEDFRFLCTRRWVREDDPGRRKRQVGLKCTENEGGVEGRRKAEGAAIEERGGWLGGRREEGRRKRGGSGDPSSTVQLGGSKRRKNWRALSPTERQEGLPTRDRREGARTKRW